MHWQNAVNLMSVLSAPVPPGDGTEGYATSYAAYLAAYSACREERQQCVGMLREVVAAAGSSAGALFGAATAVGVGSAETVYSWVPEVAEVEKVARSAVGVAAGAAQAVAGVGAGVSGTVGVAAGCAASPVACAGRGVHYLRNKQRRERRKAERKAGAASGVGLVSGREDEVAAAELDARRTLAERRAAENAVQTQLAKYRLSSLSDSSKTEAVRRLDAARMEQRINDAKAKSQASYAKCDTSLKSLGSTGSAGEFSLKQAAVKQEALKIENESLKQQIKVALAHGGAAVAAAVAEVPEPRRVGIRDVMDPPCEGWSAQEEEAYYDILDAESAGNYDTCWASRFPRPGQYTAEEAAADAARFMHG